MRNKHKKRLLFIDAHQDWLSFVKSALAEDYQVHPVKDFDALCGLEAGEKHFDLVFIGLKLAQDNIEVLSDLSACHKWQFIVLFPGFPDRGTARIFFSLGVLDMQSKPYDSESLKRMIEEEITVLERQSSKVARRGGDYQSRVQQLHEYLGVDIRNAA